MAFRSEHSIGKWRFTDELKSSKEVSWWEMTKRKQKRGVEWQTCLEDMVEGGSAGLIWSGGGG